MYTKARFIDQVQLTIIQLTDTFERCRKTNVRGVERCVYVNKFYVENIPKINFSINILGTFPKIAKISETAKILNNLKWRGPQTSYLRQVILRFFHYTDKKENQIFLIQYNRKFRIEQLQSHIWLTASSYMGKYLRISSYIRKPFFIYDFATAPLSISLYMRKILFSFFISVGYTVGHNDFRKNSKWPQMGTWFMKKT